MGNVGGSLADPASYPGYTRLPTRFPTLPRPTSFHPAGIYARAIRSRIPRNVAYAPRPPVARPAPVFVPVFVVLVIVSVVSVVVLPEDYRGSSLLSLFPLLPPLGAFTRTASSELRLLPTRHRRCHHHGSASPCHHEGGVAFLDYLVAGERATEGGGGGRSCGEAGWLWGCCCGRWEFRCD